MDHASHTRRSILNRIAHLEVELRRARVELRDLPFRDPAVAEVVLRGACLLREKAGLEQRLAVLKLDPRQTPSVAVGEGS